MPPAQIAAFPLFYYIIPKKVSHLLAPGQQVRKCS